MIVGCLGVNLGSFRVPVSSVGGQLMAKEGAVQEQSGSDPGLALGFPDGGHGASHTAKRLCRFR